ncbi:NACHT domain-containing protein [Streptomyces sp. A1547]|uniref:NACHT domain-containing protein n=1 Tax=Streptomyces sp. A1547 TaxID=2563105 RepID=UPI00109E5B7B|nr:NACHT domain-containing protein [Streptomyces sp. A1547]THA28110.1 NACHT domain-containing protein [Streptomyces sp. A1547]
MFTLLLALVSLAVAAAKALKPPAVDLVQASGKLAEAVETSELAQRTQLLGGDNQPIDVAFTFHAAPSRVASGAVPTGRLSEISDYYRCLRPRRLLIAGAAGAGKTVLAVELMLSLLEQREADEPVPVRMALAGWDTSQPLDEWMADQLADTYQLRKPTARRLIDRGCVLPILDGLDEMDAEVDAGSPRAAAALAALNWYQAGRQKGPLVVTCRTTTCDALAARRIRLLDAARVEVSSVTAEQAQRFVETRVLAPEDWYPVVDHARRHSHGAAAHVLSTPWLLTLAVTVYEAEGDPVALLRFTDPEALRSHLLDRFVPAAIELHKRAGNRVYRPEQVINWLGFLARYLSDNIRKHRAMGGHVLSGTDLVLHRLWPIAGMRARTVDIAISGIAGVVSVSWLVPFSILYPTRVPFSIIWALLVIGLIYASARSAWPVPKSISPGRLRTPEGRRAVVGPVTVAVIATLAVSLAIVVPYIGQPGYSPTLVLVNLFLLLPVGLIGGLAFGLRRNLETTASSKGPNALVRVDLRSGLLIGFSAATALAIADFGAISIAAPGPMGSVGGALIFFIISVVFYGIFVGVLGIIWASAWRRYVATVLCTRRRLPRRLGRFLAWASEAGLLRIAGNAYQFRHRELQDNLADTQ